MSLRRTINETISLIKSSRGIYLSVDQFIMTVLHHCQSESWFASTDLTFMISILETISKKLRCPLHRMHGIFAYSSERVAPPIPASTRKNPSPSRATNSPATTSNHSDESTQRNRCKRNKIRGECPRLCSPLCNPTEAPTSAPTSATTSTSTSNSTSSSTQTSTSTPTSTSTE